MSSAKAHSFNLVIKMISWVLNGIALKLLWGWFAVPLLLMPELELWHSMGMGIMIRFLTAQQIPREDTEIKHLLAYTIYTPLLAIAFGFIVHLLMTNPATQINFKL